MGDEEAPPRTTFCTARLSYAFGVRNQERLTLMLKRMESRGESWRSMRSKMLISLPLS